MIVQSSRYLALAVACAFLLSCTRGPAGSNRTSDALEVETTFEVRLPAGFLPQDVAVGVGARLELGPNVEVREEDDRFGTVTNVGDESTTVANNSKTGDILSVASVTIGNHTVVDGSVRSTGTVTLGDDGAVVTGDIEEGALLLPPSIVAWTGEVGAMALSRASGIGAARTGADQARARSLHEPSRMH